MDKRDGFSKADEKMLLTRETRSGLQITGTLSNVRNMYNIINHFVYLEVLLFVEMVRFIFTIPGVTSFLSNKLCQDSLENFFGRQRQRGRAN